MGSRATKLILDRIEETEDEEARYIFVEEDDFDGLVEGLLYENEKAN